MFHAIPVCSNHMLRDGCEASWVATVPRNLILDVGITITNKMDSGPGGCVAPEYGAGLHCVLAR